MAAGERRRQQDGKGPTVVEVLYRDPLNPNAPITPTTTAGVVDTTGAAPWSNAVITTDATTGLEASGLYAMRNGTLLQLDFNALGALNDTVLYVPGVSITAIYYGVNSNPVYPQYSFTQYNYDPSGNVISTIESVGGKTYLNSIA